MSHYALETEDCELEIRIRLDNFNFNPFRPDWLNSDLQFATLNLQCYSVTLGFRCFILIFLILKKITDE